MSVQEENRRTGGFVRIDKEFVRNQAREAVRQFFAPITAPFHGSEPPAGVIDTDVKSRVTIPAKARRR